MKRLLCILVALALVACGANTADAAFVLAIDDGVNPMVVIVDDSSAGTATENVGASTVADTSPVAGSIVYSGTVGVWTVTVTTALSKPLLAGQHLVDLSVVAVSTGAGTLIIGATDTDFVPNDELTAIQSTVGGTTGGIVDVWGEKDWVDQSGGVVSGNKEFSADFGLDASEPDVVVAQGPFSGGAFSGTVAVPHGTIPNNYSITNYVVITHGSGVVTTTLDHEVAQIPEPSSLAIFAGLAVLGFIGLRRRNKA